jgi:hypothetical protein
MNKPQVRTNKSLYIATITHDCIDWNLSHLVGRFVTELMIIMVPTRMTAVRKSL